MGIFEYNSPIETEKPWSEIIVMFELTKQFTAAHNLAASKATMKIYFEMIDNGIEVDREFAIDMFLAATLMGGEI